MATFVEALEDEQAVLDYIYEEEHLYDPYDPWPDTSRLDDSTWWNPLDFNDG